MITGVVTKDLEITVPVGLQDAAGRNHQLTAVIDTGYNGFLTLTHALVAAFGLPLLYANYAQLADGSTAMLPVHGATLNWDGQWRLIEVDVTDIKPLVGTALVGGYEMKVQMVAGGSVTLEAMP